MEIPDRPGPLGPGRHGRRYAGEFGVPNDDDLTIGAAEFRIEELEEVAVAEEQAIA